jgi:Zn-dependent M16 (insulinase) family peptidase
MKGAYSSPDQVVYRTMQQQLLTGTPYEVDSGGDPEIMPQLTYEQFKAFHHRFYSPSNARFMLYGDVPPGDNFAFLAAVLAPFERIEVDSALPEQPRWSEPKRISGQYPIGADDDTAGKTYVVVEWACNDVADAAETLTMEIAVDALLGSAGAPMRKALIDSGLGQDVFPSSGYDADLKTAVAHFGLRATEAEHTDAIETLILDTLRKVVADGLDTELIEAAFHRAEFAGKEISPPFPLMLLIRAAPMWYHGADPKVGIEFAAVVEQVRQAWKADPRLFETALQRWLLDNPHRLTVTMQPSTTMAATKQAHEAEALARIRGSLTEAEATQIREAQAALKAEQEAPDSPEALASLPTLKDEEIPRRVFTVPTEEREIAGVPALVHPVYTNGIAYVGATFDSRDVTDGEAPWLPLFGRATLGMGAAGLTYEQMATRQAQHTGGFAFNRTAWNRLRGGERGEQVAVDGRALGRNVGELFAILRDLLTQPDPTDAKRLRDLIRERAARSGARLADAGHQFAYIRAASQMGHAQARREQWDGATQVRFAKSLARETESAGVDAAVAQLRALQGRLFTRNRLTLHIAADPDLLPGVIAEAETFVGALPAGDAVTPAPDSAAGATGPSGVVIPADVNYVASVLRVPTVIDPVAPAIELLAQIVSNDYLYQKLRVQGGAYGGFCIYARESGLLPMLSYRDPHLTETFDVYEKVLDWIGTGLTDEAVDGSRIGAIGNFDSILAPGQQLAAARSRRNYGLSDADREAFRNGLFDVTAAQIRDKALPLLRDAFASAAKAALGARERLTAANDVLSAPLELFDPERPA